MICASTSTSREQVERSNPQSHKNRIVIRKITIASGAAGKGSDAFFGQDIVDSKQRKSAAKSSAKPQGFLAESVVETIR